MKAVADRLEERFRRAADPPLPVEAIEDDEAKVVTELAGVALEQLVLVHLVLSLILVVC